MLCAKPVVCSMNVQHKAFFNPREVVYDDLLVKGARNAWELNYG